MPNKYVKKHLVKYTQFAFPKKKSTRYLSNQIMPISSAFFQIFASLLSNNNH